MKIDQKLTRLMRIHKQKAVANAAGIDPLTLRNISGGKHKPSFNTAVSLARVLGVDVGWLMDDRQSWPPVRVRPSIDSDLNTPSTTTAA